MIKHEHLSRLIRAVRKEATDLQIQNDDLLKEFSTLLENADPETTQYIYCWLLLTKTFMQDGE